MVARNLLAIHKYTVCTVYPCMDNIDTSIRIKKETRDRLLEMGKKGESYDAIINRLLKVYTLHT